MDSKDLTDLHELLAKAIDTMQLGFTITDRNGKILHTNPAEARMHGYPLQDLIGNDARIFAPRELWKPMTLDQMRGIRSWRRESTNIREDGTLFPVQILSDIITDNKGEPIGIVTISEDISERKPAHYSLFDPLTGLPNRALFMDRLNRALKRIKRKQDYMFAVLIMDLDQFKSLNDTFGQVIGDRILDHCARRLENCLRFGDTIARVRSHEFAVLLEDIRDISDATFVAERILDQLAEPFRLHNRETMTTATIGIVEGEASYDRPEDILKDAETALYRAKSLGGRHFEIFDKSIPSRAAAISSMESALRRASEQNEFVVQYQPIVSLESGKMAGVEALLRWKDPQHGLLDPAEFLAVTQEPSLLQAICGWAMESAFRQASIWRKASPSLYLSFNLFSQQLEAPGFMAGIRHLLQESGLPPSAVTLEIAENLFTETNERFPKTISELKEIGFQLTIDDFGSGHSSFAYLKRFPLDALKIDPSLIQDLEVDSKNESVAATAISLAHSLDWKVIAEGVQTDEQLAFLRWHHCDEIQGSLLSPPASAQDVTALLQENHEYC